MWKRRVLRYLLPSLVFLAACALQTTTWPDLFGSFTQPPLWLLVIAWLSLYRPQTSTILFLYFLGFMASAFTAMPLKMIFFAILIMHVAIAITRERVFWTGASYFTLAAIASVGVYHAAVLVLSRFLEPSAAPLMLTDRLTQVLLALPFAGLVYVVMTLAEKPGQPELESA